jgi:hypothetical protein
VITPFPFSFRLSFVEPLVRCANLSKYSILYR